MSHKLDELAFDLYTESSDDQDVSVSDRHKTVADMPGHIRRHWRRQAQLFQAKVEREEQAELDRSAADGPLTLTYGDAQDVEDRWEFYVDNSDEWRWRRVAGNGKIVGASTEGYQQHASCVTNAIRNGFVALTDEPPVVDAPETVTEEAPYAFRVLGWLAVLSLTVVVSLVVMVFAVLALPLAPWFAYRYCGEKKSGQ